MRRLDNRSEKQQPRHDESSKEVGWLSRESPRHGSRFKARKSGTLGSCCERNASLTRAPGPRNVSAPSSEATSFAFLSGCLISDIAALRRSAPGFCLLSCRLLPEAGEIVRSAKRTLLQSCSKCGAANSESAELCYVCDASLSQTEEELAPVAISSSEPQWRLEVAHRLESYRVRRRRARGLADDSQNELPFVVDSGAAASAAVGETPNRAVRRPAESHSTRHVGIEIAVLQPSLDFATANDQSPHPSAPLVPIADIQERGRAGLLDALFLLASYIGFLVLFGSLGGQLTLGKLDAAVYGVTFFLFYAQYFALFTFFNGSTPGMHLRGLRVVSFDGCEPGAGQLLWRSFGYLISAGTLFLGFLWSLWDEDRLTWQDRISQTYITQAPEICPNTGI